MGASMWMPFMRGGLNVVQLHLLALRQSNWYLVCSCFWISHGARATRGHLYTAKSGMPKNMRFPKRVWPIMVKGFAFFFPFGGLIWRIMGWKFRIRLLGLVGILLRSLWFVIICVGLVPKLLWLILMFLDQWGASWHLIEILARFHLVGNDPQCSQLGWVRRPLAASVPSHKPQ